MTDLIAYHNDPALKSFVLTQLAEHREADKLIKGAYWQNGKGCAVGCTLEAVRLHKGKKGARIDHVSHALYESELGIPLMLARLEDKHFEALSNGDSQAWPERFISAINPGANLAMVWPRYALWLLVDELPQRTKRPATVASLAEVAALYREWVEGAKPSAERWASARRTDDAYGVGGGAAYAAYAADDAYAAYAAYAADDGYARASFWKRSADKIIELLEAA